jgi:hypothetical protein
MPLNRTKKRKAGTHGKTNNSRSNASETEYFTANDESDEDEDSFTSKSQKNTRSKSSKNRHNISPERDVPEFTATVYVINGGLPIPGNSTVFVTDIGNVPVKLEVVKEGPIPYGKLKRLDSGLNLGFIDEQFYLSSEQRNKFVVKVHNKSGRDVGYAVGVFSYSFYTIPPIPYSSSEVLHRDKKRGRKNTETSMPAGTRQINAGDPYVELKIVALDEKYAEISGFNGYHLVAICIGLLNEFHLPPFNHHRRLSDLKTLIKVPRPLNGLAYPIYVSSVPLAVKFYIRNGFMKFPPIMVRKSRGINVEIYRFPVTGSQSISTHEVPLFLVA